MFDYKPFLLDRNFTSYTKNSKRNLQKKKKDPSLCTKYRLISLLSNLNKITETLAHKRASNFLTEQNALYEKQFSFRDNRPTMLPLTEFTEKACDSGQFACGVFFDLFTVKL